VETAETDPAELSGDLPEASTAADVLVRFVIHGAACAIVPSTAAESSDCLGRFVVRGRSYAIVRAREETRADLLDQLTPRELDIALLIAAGHESKQVARRLRISFHTVRVHIGRIYGKLGLHKQTELAVLVSARYGAISEAGSGDRRGSAAPPTGAPLLQLFNVVLMSGLMGIPAI
jgi:DNA-binding CsgD family transcriptional regulator